MSLSSRVAYNTIIQIISKIISSFLGLFAIAIMTRYLGQAGFGQYTTILTFLSFFAIIADLGLTLVTVQMISREEANQDKIISNLFSLRLVSAVIFLGLAPLVVIFFPYDPLIKLGVMIATLSFFFASLNQIFVGLYQKNLKMQIVSSAEIVGRIILLIGVIIVVYLKFDLIGLLIATIFSNAVSFAIHYWYSRSLAKIRLQFDYAIWREILKKSWPLSLTIMFNLIYLRADIFILSLYRSQAEVGIYGATYKVIDVLTTLPFIFAGIILPILTAAWLTKNIDRFKRVLQKSFDLMVILAWPLLIGTQFVAKPLMILVAGNNFSASGDILNILIIAIGFIFLGTLFAHAVIGMNLQKKIIIAYIFTAITSVIGYLIFIPRYSYFGAAWVTVYSELAIALASFFVTVKYSKFSVNLNIFFKSLAASLVMGAILYLIADRLNLALVLLIAALIYFIVLYIFKGLEKKDLLVLFNKE